MSVLSGNPASFGPCSLPAFCPPPGLGARYLQVLQSAQSAHPLRSLGRLVSDARTVMPLAFSSTPVPPPPVFTPSCHQTRASGLREGLRFPVSASPFLQQQQQKQEEETPPVPVPMPVPVPVRTEHSPGSLSRFNSPFSHKSPSSSSPSSSSSSPDKAFTCVKEQTRTYNFTEEDLYTVLYGYSRNQQLGLGHAISGISLHTDPVSDRLLPDIDAESLELPEGLTIHQTSCGNVPHYGVFADKNSIPKGTRFGPFQGKLVNTSEIKTYDDNTLMWEIFENGRLSHFVDGRGVSANWMSLVQCARFPEEQNVVALQCDAHIYYETCREVRAQQELLVWYGDGYVQFLGIPIALKDFCNETEPAPAEDSGEGFKCDRCGKVFAYKYYRDKHLKYTRCVDQGDRKFPCHLCNRSFEKRDRLRIHVLHVHEKHRPHKCSVCGKSFSQSSSLNKHMRVHSGERPYKCVYCNKAFTASSILRTHIRQHSGERPFKCKHCGKSFASHAAHDSHVRRTHAKEAKTFSCHVCACAFTEPDQLKVHMKMHKKRSLDSTLLPPSPGPRCADERTVNSSFPFTGVNTISPEYRPWN